MGASPRVVDWNNDGKKDLLVGDRFDGTITIYINTNTDRNPIFTQQGLVMVGGTNFVADGDTAEPFPVDWNNDGKVDVVCGGSGGRLKLLINEGTASVPVFNTSVYIRSGGADIDADGGKSKPCVADWNSDGMYDWWENRYLPGGTNSLPTGDYDGDGLSNSEEFRCRTDPANASSVLKLDGVNASGSGTVINWTASTGVSYRVQSCLDLMAPVWSNVSALLNTGTYMVTPTQSHQYYRIVVP